MVPLGLGFWAGTTIPSQTEGSAGVLSIGLVRMAAVTRRIQSPRLLLRIGWMLPWGAKNIQDLAAIVSLTPTNLVQLTNPT